MVKNLLEAVQSEVIEWNYVAEGCADELRKGFNLPL